VGFKFESAEFLGSGFYAGGIVATIEIGGNGQAGLGGSCADEVENLLVAVEGFTGPVFGDLREEAMLNRIPLRSTSRIVSDSDSEVETIGKLRLEFCFPSPAAATITTARVRENEQFARVRMLQTSLTLPPMTDSVRSEGGCVVRNADDNRPTVDERLVDAIRDGDAECVGAKVMIIDEPGLAVPTSAGVFEVADQFAFLGIDTDDGKATAAEALP